MLAPGMSWVIPYLCVSDVRKSLDFYKQAFKFEIIDTMTETTDHLVHAEMRYRDIIIMVGLEGQYTQAVKTPKHSHHASPISLYIYVDDINSFYQQAIDQGAISVCEPEDAFWGDRCCQLEDLDGYIWFFGSYMLHS